MIISDPKKIGSLYNEIPLLLKIRNSFKVDSAWQQVGMFENTRVHCEWRGLHLEVDETRYEFGTGWELEAETDDDPQQVKALIETDLLQSNGIPCADSQRSKFANFLNRSIA